MSRILVVGAGITGLTAASLLARRDSHVTLVESGTEPGGLLAPVGFRGHAVDRGSHRVHPASDPLLRELTPNAGWVARPRRGRLVLGARSAAYPPSPASFLRALGPRGALSVAAGLLARPTHRRSWEAAHSDATDDEGFADFVRARAGDAAYERFYAPYAEKVWGLDPRELSRTVAKQRISTEAPLRALRRALFGRDDRFLYPRHGMGALVAELTAELATRGVHVQRRRAGVHGLAEGYDAVLYTGPLADLAPHHDLRHRGLYLVHVALPAGAVDPAIDTWYTPDRGLWFGRVSRPAAFSAALGTPGEDVLCVEIPEGRWGPGVDFLARSGELLAQLRAAGIVRRGDPYELQQTWVPDVYPLYTRGWVQRWRAALRDIQGPVLPLGRQGLFLHCNLDHCVSMAQAAVAHLDAGRDAASWRASCDRWLGLRVRD